MSAGARVCGRFFRAAGPAPAATVLLIPGWPGNPNDVLGLGALLAEQGVSAAMFNPRGLHASEGEASFANTLHDIGVAWHWLQEPDTVAHFGIDPARLVLGGHSFGGGLALAYAAGDASVGRVVGIAANDHGAFIREFQRNPAMAASIRRALLSTLAPAGPARCDLEATLQELVEHQDVYGLRENAPRLAGRALLLIGGWDDREVTVEQCLLPLYRALKQAGAADVTVQMYHTNHEFDGVRERLAAAVAAWVLQPVQAAALAAS